MFTSISKLRRLKGERSELGSLRKLLSVNSRPSFRCQCFSVHATHRCRVHRWASKCRLSLSQIESEVAIVHQRYQCWTMELHEVESEVSFGSAKARYRSRGAWWSWWFFRLRLWHFPCCQLVVCSRVFPRIAKSQRAEHIGWFDSRNPRFQRCLHRACSRAWTSRIFRLFRVDSWWHRSWVVVELWCFASSRAQFPPWTRLSCRSLKTGSLVSARHWWRRMVQAVALASLQLTEEELELEPAVAALSTRLAVSKCWLCSNTWGQRHDKWVDMSEFARDNNLKSGNN